MVHFGEMLSASAFNQAYFDNPNFDPGAGLIGDGTPTGGVRLLDGAELFAESNGLRLTSFKSGGQNYITVELSEWYTGSGLIDQNAMRNQIQSLVDPNFPVDNILFGNPRTNNAIRALYGNRETMVEVVDPLNPRLLGGARPKNAIDDITNLLYTSSNARAVKAKTIKGSMNQLAADNLSSDKAVADHVRNSAQAVEVLWARDEAYDNLQKALGEFEAKIDLLGTMTGLTPAQIAQRDLMQQYLNLTKDLGEYHRYGRGWDEAEQLVKRGDFVDNWVNYLTEVGASDFSENFKNKMANAQKPFTSVFNGVPDSELLEYASIPLSPGETDPKRIHAQTQSRLYIGTVAEAQILKNKGSSIDTAFARAQVYIDGIPVISNLYTNAPSSGAPYKESDFTQSLPSGQNSGPIPVGVSSAEQ